MKFSVALWAFTVLLCLAVLTSPLDLSHDAELAAQFSDFKQLYGKQYASAVEEHQRFENFQFNLEKMKRLQEANPYAVFRVNRFFDRSEAEFGQTHLNRTKHLAASKAATVNSSRVTVSVEGAPEQVDWREKGAVTHVKNQGDCKSSWAFAIIGNIEGQWKLAGHPLVSLSEQQLVSCDDIDLGCYDGLSLVAFDWLTRRANGKVYTEESYPYVSGQEFVPVCDTYGKEVGATITGYFIIENNEDVMAAWLAQNGPIAVIVDKHSFHSYSGGVLTNCISSEFNHDLLLVGYNNTAHPPYWIAKNSWGTEWGEGGYIRLEKGINACRLASWPSSAVVSRVASESNSSNE